MFFDAFPIYYESIGEKKPTCSYTVYYHSTDHNVILCRAQWRDSHRLKYLCKLTKPGLGGHIIVLDILAHGKRSFQHEWQSKLHFVVTLPINSKLIPFGYWAKDLKLLI